MSVRNEPADDRMFDELQELVAMEMKDILATAAEEGFAPRDVISALEMALQAEIEALADRSEIPSADIATSAISATTDPNDASGP